MLLLFCAVLLLTTAIPALQAQTATGQITGQVTDASGAVIPGVKVTLTNQRTGLVRISVTTDTGSYSFPLLQVGVYSVAGERQGFSTAKRSDINLNVDQVVRVDLPMSLGTTTETINVAASALALDTDTAGIGHVVTTRQVTELPLNGRNFLQLLFLGAGAVETTGEQGTMRQGALGAISINGSRPTSNNYLLDGTANTDTALGTAAAILSVDAIQEFKEQTATYSAEYGFSANQVNIISKSGTNELHGAVFWFLRNDALDANNFFNNERNIRKTKLRQNQFGFVAGGPAFIPKIYDGRSRTHWLVNYEGRRTRQGAADLLTIPTPDQLAGRFTTAITDPLTGNPFPGNSVPENRFTRLARLAGKLYPAPNTNQPAGNYIRNRALPNDTDQYTVRVDQQLGRRGTVFGRITDTDWTNIALGNTTQLGDNFFIQKTRNWQVSHQIPIRPTLVNQFRIGYIEATANQNGVAAPQSDIDALQLTGTFQNLPDEQRTYPGIQGFGGVGAGLAGIGSAVNDFTASNQPMWDVSNGTTWIRGRHTLNIGFNYRRWWLQRDLANDFNGQFTFSGFFTGNRTRDHAVADMLLGYFSAATAFQPAGFGVAGKVGNPREFNYYYVAPYIQDDWKVTSRLTFNLGVRWDYRNIPYETNNRMGWRDLANPRGGLLVADQTLVDRGGVGDSSSSKFAGRRNPREASKRVFAPRLGFAYRPFSDDKTVVRGGFGVFFDSAEGREIDGASDIYPYVSRLSTNQTLGQANPLTTNQMFPPVSFSGAVNPATNSFLAVSMSPQPRNPYVQQWSFGIQRALTGDTTIEVNYIGNKGTNLLTRRQINQAFQVRNPSACAANPAIGDCPIAARRPFPNFGVYIDSDWGANSSYNAGNAKIQHRSGWLLFSSAYTWAKSIDTKSAAAGIGNDVVGFQGNLFNHDIRRDRGRSSFDVDHRVVSSVVLEIPVGRGRKYLTSANRALDAIIGGWQVNGIVTFQSGFPMDITAADVGGLNDTFGANRADIAGELHPGGFNSTKERYFNTAAFRQPGVAVFGNAGRNILRAPGINNWDTGLFKRFQFTERVRTEFRFESFNAWNHTQWGTPVRNVADPNFGRILGARPARINQLGLKVLF
ncbi:MAG: TonB-dependent receptor [Acidobacteria bacterium]|nr:TonB-dependent receptor [Acidobacteriota bacterium]